MKELLQTYLEGRESNTMKCYGSAYRVLRDICRDQDLNLFRLKEDELCDIVLEMVERKKSETQLKQVMAVVSIIEEVIGSRMDHRGKMFEVIKKSAIKKMNFGKKTKKRKGTTADALKRLHEEIYKKTSKKERMRFLMMMTVCYFGCKRFGDISKIKNRNVVIREDKNISVWIEKNKTDVYCRGEEFRLTGRNNGGFSISKMLKWYRKELGPIPDEGYLFPFFKKNGQPVFSKAVSYNAARVQLEQEKRRLSLPDLKWHSGRIGAATRGAQLGAGRQVIKRAGNWQSDAVDGYMQVDSPCVVLGDILLADWD